MELLEKGRVRFWCQVEKCTSACNVEYAFNDAIITQGKVLSLSKMENLANLYTVLYTVSHRFRKLWFKITTIQTRILSVP